MSQIPIVCIPPQLILPPQSAHSGKTNQALKETPNPKKGPHFTYTRISTYLFLNGPDDHQDLQSFLVSGFFVLKHVIGMMCETHMYLSFLLISFFGIMHLPSSYSMVK